MVYFLQTYSSDSMVYFDFDYYGAVTPKLSKRDQNWMQIVVKFWLLHEKIVIGIFSFMAGHKYLKNGQRSPVAWPEKFQSQK